MRIGFEGWIAEIRDFRFVTMQLHKVRAVDPPKVSARAAFIEPQQGRERIERALMDIERSECELAKL